MTMRSVISAILFAALLIVPNSSNASILSESGEWATAISLMFLSHELGHQFQADDMDVPMSWTFNNGGPRWSADYSKDLTIVEVRKFNSQDEREAYTSTILHSSACKGIKNCQVLSKPLGNDLYTVEYPNAHGIQYEAPRKQALIAGAGFRGQQTTARLLEGNKLQRKYLVVSALNKIGYASFPHSLQLGVSDTGGGDVATFLNTRAEIPAQVALLLSGACDLWKAYSGHGASNWSLEFWQAENGAPGLIFTVKF